MPGAAQRQPVPRPARPRRRRPAPRRRQRAPRDRRRTGATSSGATATAATQGRRDGLHGNDWRGSENLAARPQRLQRRRPRPRGQSRSRPRPLLRGADASFDPERRWTAAAAVAADVEAGDERRDVSPRPAGARSPGRAFAGARAAGRSRRPRPQGFPDRRRGGERAHRGGAQGRRSRRSRRCWANWRDFVPDRDDDLQRRARAYLAAWDESHKVTSTATPRP